MTLKQILAEIKRLNNDIEAYPDRLIKEIERYQIEYEKELLKVKFDVDSSDNLKGTVKNYNKAQSLNMARRLGWSSITDSYIDGYNEISALTRSFHASIGINVAEFNYRDIRVLRAAKLADKTNMLTEGAMLDQLVKKELVNQIALGSSRVDSIDRLSRALLGSVLRDKKQGTLARYANTYLRTSAQGLTRMIDKEIYDELGFDRGRWLYAGTSGDSRIRHFCAARVGKDFTTTEVKKFPAKNKSGLDPWFSPGGWNCRHRMVPVDLIED